MSFLDIYIYIFFFFQGPKGGLRFFQKTRIDFVDQKGCPRLVPLTVKVSTHWCNVVLTWMVDGSTEFMVDAHAWRSLERQRLGGFKRCRSTIGKAGCSFSFF